MTVSAGLLSMRSGEDAEARPASDRQAATRALWQRTLPETLTRVDCLAQAVACLLEGRLDTDLRERACRAAHQIAGSVGSFGFADASARARAVHAQLLGASTDEAVLLRLCEHVQALREQLDPRADGPAGGECEGTQGRIAVVTTDAEWQEQVRGEAAARGWCTSWLRDVAALRDPADFAAVLVDLANAPGDRLALLTAVAAGQPPVVAVTASEEVAEWAAVARAGVSRILPSNAGARDAVDAVTDAVASCSLSDVTAVVWCDHGAPEALTAGLAQLGMQVVTVDGQTDAWDAIGQHRPGLLLAQAEPADVADLCRVVRADGRWSRLPVIALAHDDAGVALRLLEAGADDVLRSQAAASSVLAHVKARLARARLVERDVEIDPLTGLPNLAGAHRSVDRLLSMARRQGTPLAVAAVRVDNFDRLNDLHGGATGDAVLQLVARQLRDAFRAEDVAAHLGGGEFLLALHGSRREHAADRLRTLLRDIAQIGVASPSPAPVRVSLSAGVAEFPSDGRELAAVHRAASEALRRARQLGGSAVAVAGVQPARDPTTVDVVIVEDDAVLANLLGEALGTRGLHVVHLTDGQEALQQVASPNPRLRPRVVLLDVDLPGVDGFAVLRRFAEAGTLEHTRVIVVTVHSTESETLTALESGAFDHVCKPFSLPVLLERVRHALED